jgi:hypothetical protein
MAGKLKATQDLRQLAGGELAGSARAVAELGEPSGRSWHRIRGHCRRIYRWAPRYLAAGPSVVPYAFWALARR